MRGVQSSTSFISLRVSGAATRRLYSKRLAATQGLYSKPLFGSLLPFSRFVHLLSQTERPPVCQIFLDVGEALFFGSAFAGIVPAERVLSIGRPDGILLFVVDDYVVDCRVFSFVAIHTRLTLPLIAQRLF